MKTIVDKDTNELKKKTGRFKLLKHKIIKILAKKYLPDAIDEEIKRPFVAAMNGKLNKTQLILFKEELKTIFEMGDAHILDTESLRQIRRYSRELTHLIASVD